MESMKDSWLIIGLLLLGLFSSTQSLEAQNQNPKFPMSYEVGPRGHPLTRENFFINLSFARSTEESAEIIRRTRYHPGQVGLNNDDLIRLSPRDLYKISPRAAEYLLANVYHFTDEQISLLSESNSLFGWRNYLSTMIYGGIGAGIAAGLYFSPWAALGLVPYITSGTLYYLTGDHTPGAVTTRRVFAETGIEISLLQLQSIRALITACHKNPPT